MTNLLNNVWKSQFFSNFQPSIYEIHISIPKLNIFFQINKPNQIRNTNASLSSLINDFLLKSIFFQGLNIILMNYLLFPVLLTFDEELD